MAALRADAAHSIEQSFDPEKILVRHPLRQRAKKRTIAAAKIDVQWHFASENLFQIQTIRERFDCESVEKGRACGELSYPHPQAR